MYTNNILWFAECSQKYIVVAPRKSIQTAELIWCGLLHTSLCPDIIWCTHFPVSRTKTCLYALWMWVTVCYRQLNRTVQKWFDINCLISPEWDMNCSHSHFLFSALVCLLCEMFTPPPPKKNWNCVHFKPQKLICADCPYPREKNPNIVMGLLGCAKIVCPTPQNLVSCALWCVLWCTWY